MRFLPTLVLFVALRAVPLLAQSATQISDALKQFVTVSEPLVALNHVRVVDGTGAPPADDQTVVISAGKIQSVGRFGAVQVPTGARALDLTGHTVIPGLVGLHDHSFYGGGGWPYAFSPVAVPRLYLASGVTTTRTTGSLAPYDELNLSKSIERGAALGPRMFITGPYLNSGPPALTAMVRVDTPEDARRVVRYWAEEGVTWFKAYAQINRAALGAAIDEAHKHNLKVTAHLCSVGFREAVALGIDGLEHGLPTNLEYHPDKKPDVCPSTPMDWSKVDVNSPEVQATFRDMVSHHVAMTSTLAVFELGYANRPPLDERVLDAMYTDTRASYLANRARADQAARSEVPLKKAMEYDVAFVKAGGLLAAGVDPTGNGGALPGYGDQRNYELLQEAGFTPVQAIAILTGNGAKVPGQFDRFGSVTAGKSADLVVIKGDPIAKSADIRNVTIVFKDGVGYDSPKLIESIKGTVGLR